MADVKISQLPAATTPVDGTEVLPIVQSATTKQVSIANLTAGRAMSASSLTLTNPLAVTSGGTGIATTAAGTLLSSTALNTISATATPTLGVAGTTAGTLGLSGSTSGVVTLATAAAAGTWTFTLPTSGGSNGWILTTNGSGVSTWTNPTALGVDLDVGTTAITGGTTGRVLYNNAGVLGEYAITGTGSVVLGTSPTFTTSAIFPAGAVGAPGITTTGDTNTGIYFPAADTIGFVEGGVESMRLDASGNLGLGVTPSAWVFYQKSLDLGGAGNYSSLSGRADYTSLSNNAYINTSGVWTYKNTGHAAQEYFQSGGVHAWRIAPSGTAGNAISFTQAMTLTASGELLIGQTSSAYSSANRGLISLNGTNEAYFGFNVGGAFKGYLAHTGTDFLLENQSTGAIRFYTNSSPSASIDSIGNLLVGTTSNVSNDKVLIAQTSANTWSQRFLCNNYGGVVDMTASSGIAYYFVTSTSTYAGQISLSGASTSFTSASDISMKKNIGNSHEALASILSMPIRQFDWKEDNAHVDYGFIAQEINEVAPEIVTRGDKWSVDYGRITPRLIKAVQELAAELAILKGQING